MRADLFFNFQEKRRFPERCSQEGTGNEAQSTDDKNPFKHQRHFCRLLATIPYIPHLDRHFHIFSRGKLYKIGMIDNNRYQSFKDPSSASLKLRSSMSSVQSAATGHLGQNSSAHVVLSRAATWTLITFK